jgi:hypothetical protein
LIVRSYHAIPARATNYTVSRFDGRKGKSRLEVSTGYAADIATILHLHAPRHCAISALRLANATEAQCEHIASS